MRTMAALCDLITLELRRVPVGRAIHVAARLCALNDYISISDIRAAPPVDQWLGLEVRAWQDIGSRLRSLLDVSARRMVISKV